MREWRRSRNSLSAVLWLIKQDVNKRMRMLADFLRDAFSGTDGGYNPLMANKRESGPTIAVILEMIGEDRMILQLPDRTACPSYGAPRQLDDDVFYAAVTIIQEWAPQEVGMSRLTEWLTAQQEYLETLGARKTLEFQSRIFPGQGSESLSLPLELLRRAVETGCEIRHQYMRSD